MPARTDANRVRQYEGILRGLYGSDPEALVRQRRRYGQLLESLDEQFAGDRPIELYSAPGRTEVGGNHTDHNGGRVLAAAVDLDIVAAACPNSDGVIRIRSDAYPSVDVGVQELDPVAAERFTPPALVRGVCARMREMGHIVGGFDACTSSAIPEGSGLSSSAAFEVLIAVILNHLYNGDSIDVIPLARIAQYAENVYFGKPCGLMDQTASLVGGLVTIDFADFERPAVRKVDFDFSARGFCVVIVDTGASHADLHADYAAVEGEMKAVASALGGDVLRRFTKREVLDRIGTLRSAVSDRAILRSLHFYDDDQRVADQVSALERGDWGRFLELVIESGRSSWMLCQNCFSCTNVAEQGLAIALAVSENVLKGNGAWRVHGGGFAGTIQVFAPNRLVDEYVRQMEAIFGENSCHQAMIRTTGASHLGFA